MVLDAVIGVANQVYSISSPQSLLTTSLQLPHWRAAKGRVLGATGTARIACIGDSITEGYYSNGSSATNIIIKSYPTQLASILTTHGITSISQNVFGGSLSNKTTSDPRLTLGGTWTYLSNPYTLGGAFFTNAASGSGNMSFTPSINVDTFNIYYATSPGFGTFGAQINSGSVTSQSQNSAQNMAKLTVTATLSANTLNLTWVSGGAVYIVGIEAYNSAIPSVQIDNIGWAGATSILWNGNGITPGLDNLPNAIPTLLPDLTILCLGANDWNTGVTLAQFNTNMQGIITAAASVGDVILMSSVPSNPSSTVPYATQIPFQSTTAQLAVLNNLPYIDIYSRWFSNETTMNNLGMMGDNSQHPNTVGYADITQAIYNILTL